LTLFISFGCVSDGDELELDPNRDCSAINQIFLLNRSQYTIKRLYLHETTPFIENQTPALMVGSNLSPQGQIVTPFNPGQSRYITFIREFTTQIQTEIAVTTSRPLYFTNCQSVTLDLLEEDFYLRK